MRSETLPLKSAAPFGSQNPQESDITHRPDGCVPLGRVRHYSSDKPQLDQKWIDQTHKKQWKPPVLAMMRQYHCALSEYSSEDNHRKAVSSPDMNTCSGGVDIKCINDQEECRRMTKQGFGY